MKRIVICGKGGIGKSTTAVHLSVALALQGLCVMQIGCDPKSDSTRNLMDGKRIPTVREQCREKGDALRTEDIVASGYAGVLCMETGGDVTVALKMLESLYVFDNYQPDIVLFDMPGDTFCVGFTQDVYIVTSGERMALHTAKGIATAIRDNTGQGHIRLAGIILNQRHVDSELSNTRIACAEMDAPLLGMIPRNEDIQKAEKLGGTVFEHVLDSDLCGIYTALANQMIANGEVL